MHFVALDVLISKLYNTSGEIPIGTEKLNIEN